MRPLCRYCGRPLPMRAKTYFVVKDLATYPNNNDDIYAHVEGPVNSRAEAARLVNAGTVISVRYFRPDKQGGLSTFRVWDGKTYSARGGFFCTNACAMDLGKMACRAPHNLAGPGYLAAMRRRRENENANVSQRL